MWFAPRRPIPLLPPAMTLGAPAAVPPIVKSDPPVLTYTPQVVLPSHSARAVVPEISRPMRLPWITCPDPGPAESTPTLQPESRLRAAGVVPPMMPPL